MSKAVQCDRCGSFESFNSLKGKQYHTFREAGWRTLVFSDDIGSIDESFYTNLCPNCASEFEKFMHPAKMG